MAARSAKWQNRSGEIQCTNWLYFGLLKENAIPRYAFSYASFYAFSQQLPYAFQL